MTIASMILFSYLYFLPCGPPPLLIECSYGFQEGESLEDSKSEGSEIIRGGDTLGSSESSESDEEKGNGGATAASAKPGQLQQQQQQSKLNIIRSGHGPARTRAPHEYKAHHQKDRALRKRNRIWS